MKKDDCIFCKLANGEIPTNKIYEDEDFTVILDLGPATRGHALILPKDHADCLFDLPDETEKAGFSKATKALLCGDKLKALGWKPYYDIETGIARTIGILRDIKEK